MASQSGSEIPSFKTAKHFRNARHAAESSFDCTSALGGLCCTDGVVSVSSFSSDFGVEAYPPMTAKLEEEIQHYKNAVNILVCKRVVEYNIDRHINKP